MTEHENNAKDFEAAAIWLDYRAGLLRVEGSASAALAKAAAWLRGGGSALAQSLSAAEADKAAWWLGVDAKMRPEMSPTRGAYERAAGVLQTYAACMRVVEQSHRGRA